MLFIPTIGSALSGKLGGIVASHNAGGSYFRLFVIPTNPNTVFQIAVRALMAQLTAIWSTNLTQAQRDSWDLYADNVKIVNRIGLKVNISGEAMYVRCNIPRLQGGGARVDDGPADFNLGAMSRASVSNATVAGQSMDVAFSTGPLADPWASEVGSFLLIYTGRPQNAGIQYFTGPYRFATALQGDPIPPVSPVTVNTQFAFVLGQRLFIRTRVSYADGRLTADNRATTIAVA